MDDTPINVEAGSYKPEHLPTHATRTLEIVHVHLQRLDAAHVECRRLIPGIVYLSISLCHSIYF